jgi:hypothetical protein
MPPRSALLELDVYGIRDLEAVKRATTALLVEAGFDLADPRLLTSVSGGDLLTVSALSRQPNPAIFEPAWREEVHLRLFRADPSCGVRIRVADPHYADEKRVPVAG